MDEAALVATKQLTAKRVKRAEEELPEERAALPAIQAEPVQTDKTALLDFPARMAQEEWAVK